MEGVKNPEQTVITKCAGGPQNPGRTPPSTTTARVVRRIAQGRLRPRAPTETRKTPPPAEAALPFLTFPIAPSGAAPQAAFIRLAVG